MTRLSLKNYKPILITIAKHRHTPWVVACVFSLLGFLSYSHKLKQAEFIIDDQSAQIISMSDEQASLEKEVDFLRRQNITLSNTIQERADNEQNTNPVENLYNPEQSTYSNQSSMDALKKRYEEILVTYFFLKKCNRNDALDFHIITSALSQEMASVNAPGRLQHDIVTAAQGSYREMYYNTPCDSQIVEALSKQYKAYIASLSVNFNFK